MKITTIPMLQPLTRSIEYRKVQHAFIAHGLKSAARSKQSGKYISADRVIDKLTRRLAKASDR